MIDFNKFSEARKLIEKGLEIDSNSITGKSLLLKTLSGEEIIDRIDDFLFFKEKNPQVQEIIAEKIIDIDPKLALEFLDKKNSKHFFVFKPMFFKIEEFSDSIFFAKKFIQAFPRDLNGFLNAGWISIKVNNFDEAIDYF